MSAIHKAEGSYSETEIDGEVVAMNLGNGDFFSLTGTARAIWRLLDGTRDQTAVIAALAAEYEAEADSIAPEVGAFLAQLDEAGLTRRD